MQLIIIKSDGMNNNNNTHDYAPHTANHQTSRRDALKTVLAAGALFASGTSLASEHNHMHNHGAMKSNTEVIDAALECIKNGQACIDHCIELFKTGNNSVAECADTVQEMLAMCTSLSQMASYKSKHLGELAKICMQVCTDCEKACREHEDKHAECKACAESCAHCASACKKIAA